MFTFICRHFAAWVRYFLIICIPVAGHAQTLDLYDAVNRTIANYPLIQQRQAEVSAGKAHVNTVNSNRLPSFVLQDQLSAGTNNSIAGPYFSLGMVPSTPGGSLAMAPNYSPVAGNVAISFLQWELYNFGYYRAQKKEAQSQLAVSEAYLGSDRYLLTENIVALYLDWLKKYRLQQIQQQNMQRAQVILTSIRANVLSGLRPGVDSSTASAAYSDARIAYLQAMDDYNYDRITISSYTGLKNELMPDTSFITSAILKDPLVIPLTDSVQLSHPVLNVYQKQYEQQLADNGAMSKKYLPKVGIDGAAWVRNSGISYSGAYPDGLSDGMPYNKYNYLMALTVSYNLFDMKHRHDQIVEGRFAAQAKQSALQTQQLAMDQMMLQANSRYQTTLEKLKEIPIQLNSARQAYIQQSALFRSGLNTLIEVTNAQYALLQAETNYVITQDELLQLLYIRAGLAGQLDNFLQNLKR